MTLEQRSERVREEPWWNLVERFRVRRASRARGYLFCCEEMGGQDSKGYAPHCLQRKKNQRMSFVCISLREILIFLIKIFFMQYILIIFSSSPNSSQILPIVSTHPTLFSFSLSKKKTQKQKSKINNNKTKKCQNKMKQKGHKKKKNRENECFPFPKGYHLQIASWLRVEPCVHFPLSARKPYGLGLSRSCVCCLGLSGFLWASVLLCLFPWTHPSSLTCRIFLHPHRSLSLKKEGIRWSHLI